jgi:hypothetical protein
MHGMLPGVIFRQLLPALLLAFLAGCSSPPPRPHAPSAEVQQTVPAEALNPDVRQDTIQQTICQPGYTASVRPSTTFTNGVKSKLLREQGLPTSDAPKYELDHLIPLALGGHPRSLKNLALQEWDGENGAIRKDQLERRMQVLVCTGRLSLDTARSSIYFDWQGAFRRYMPRRDLLVRISPVTDGRLQRGFVPAPADIRRCHWRFDANRSAP